MGDEGTQFCATTKTKEVNDVTIRVTLGLLESLVYHFGTEAVPLYNRKYCNPALPAILRETQADRVRD